MLKENSIMEEKQKKKVPSLLEIYSKLNFLRRTFSFSDVV